jgi:hypothetical protein
MSGQVWRSDDVVEGKQVHGRLLGQVRRDGRVTPAVAADSWWMGLVLIGRAAGSGRQATA